MSELKSYRVEKDVEIPMRDGAILRADIWRPDDAEAYPALVQRSPYGKEFTGSEDWFRLEGVVPRGYAVVAQDVRGLGASDGAWGWQTPEGWTQEASDTYDTVEWVAAQPWCNGSVGIYGRSYLGAIAFLGAGGHPPHLKAIAPSVTASGEDAHLENGAGALRLKFRIFFHLAMTLVQLPRLLEQNKLSESDAARIRELARDSREIIEYLPLLDCPYLDFSGLPFTMKDLVARSDLGFPSSFHLDEIDIPVLLIGGWHDGNAAKTVNNFVKLSTTSSGGDGVRSAHRLVMGPWTHNIPYGVQGDIDFGAAASARAVGMPTQLAFFGKHLKGDGEELPAVRYFLMGADEWRTAETFPPPGTTTQTWYLRNDSLSQDAPHSSEEPDTYLYDPGNPVPTVGGRVHGVDGPRDQSRLIQRADVRRYVSDVLTNPVDIIGWMNFILFASSSARDTDFVAKIIDVHPDGAAMLISSALIRARYRNGAANEVLIEPGEVVEYRFNLGPTAIRLSAGHRLAIYVCSSDFPNFDRNMNTGNPNGADAEPVVATQAIFHDLQYPSRLEIEVMPLASD